MKRISCVCVVSALCLMIAFAGFAQQRRSPGRSFKVYAFIPYSGYIRNGEAVKTNFRQLQDYLGTLGISGYDLIYENRISDFPGGDKKQGVINRSKLDPLAHEASGMPGVLVALDLEGWNRFDTLHTPDKLIDAIKAFRQTDPTNPVGLYATVPQDTYGYPKDYSRLNKAYSKVAAVVDYFSPSLYNYKTADTAEWKKGAAFNIEACKKYGYPYKKIIPYITPEIKVDGHARLLNYDEMLYRLKTLYEQGADGCLLWGSSGARDDQGNRVVVDENDGWLKAVKDFIKQHH